MAASRKRPTFEKQYKTAIARGRGAQLRAASASYDTTTKRIAIELSNGTLFAFPPSLVQGLRDATPEALAAIEIYGAGTALHWEQLDVDFELSALLAGVFGTRTWMRELGRNGGSVSSPAKARAARANGRKGGRPRSA
jgi:hypothetical protein